MRNAYNPDEQPSCPRVRKLMAKLERCAATEHEGYLDGPLARVIMAQDKRELLDELKKNLSKRWRAAIEGLSAEERKDERAIKRALDKANEDLMTELGI